MFIINKIPGLRLRYSETEERLGADMVEMGEVAYSILPASEMILEATTNSSTPVNRVPSSHNSDSNKLRMSQQQQHRSLRVTDDKDAEELPGSASTSLAGKQAPTDE